MKCDALGYFPGDELRHAMILGKTDCPFTQAADLDAARKNPQVSTWSLLEKGRIAVTRTDVAGHVEEWDVFTVTRPFVLQEVTFAKGDLAAYIRRENGNAVGATTQFRHLQRLR